MGSAAGLAANSAFGSFGHSIAPGSIGSSGMGSGHFGSSSNGVRKTSSRAAIPSQWSAQDPSLLSPTAGASLLRTRPRFIHISTWIPVAPKMMSFPPLSSSKNIPFSVKRSSCFRSSKTSASPCPTPSTTTLIKASSAVSLSPTSRVQRKPMPSSPLSTALTLAAANFV